MQGSKCSDCHSVICFQGHLHYIHCSDERSSGGQSNCDVMVFGFHIVGRHNHQKLGGTEWRKGIEIIWWMPLVPKSSALSHKLHHLVAIRSEQTIISCFRDVCFLALLTDWDQSCFRMMFRRSMKALEVRESDRDFCNIHPSPSSSRSHLHCSTTLIL